MKLQYNDRQHAYYLDGKRCRSVTAVAKIPDDTYALDQWRKRQVVVGMAINPALVEQAAAHHDDRGQLDRIAEDATAAAKAHDAANRGTAIHRIAERVDLGQDIIDTPLSRAVRAAWLRALDLAGLEIVPELTERIVVYPDQRVCGRFDRIVRRRTDGMYCVLDLKTGEGAVRYPHAVAAQLAMYAHAPILAAPVPGQGGSTEEFEQLPAMDLSLGYVVHMASTDEVAVFGVDIAAGWEAVDRLCFGTLQWRQRNDLLFPCLQVPINEGATDNGDTGSHPQPSDHTGIARGNGPTSDQPGTAVPQTKQARREARLALERPGTPENHAVDAELRYQWLRARLQAIAATNLDTGALEAVAAGWPADTPTLKRFSHDDPALDRITVLLDDVERNHQLPFGPNLSDFIPASDPAAAVESAFPGSVEVATDEQRQPYINWLRQLVERDSSSGERVAADLEAVGLRKSLSRDEWTPVELRQLDTILRRAERGVHNRPATSTSQLGAMTPT